LTILLGYCYITLFIDKPDIAIDFIEEFQAEALQGAINLPLQVFFTAHELINKMRLSLFTAGPGKAACRQKHS